MKKNKSRYSFYICAIFLLLSTFLAKRWEDHSNAILTYDAAGYYLYLPSFFYDDLGKMHNKEMIMQRYHPFGTFEEAGSTAHQHFMIKYTCGIALLELPAFGLAHCWASAAGYPVDGFSFPYQVCINFWSILFAILGLYLLRKILIRYFTDEAVAVTLIILCTASNLYNFISFSGNMSHSYLFTLYAALLLITDDFYTRSTLKSSVLLGLCAGSAVLIRPTEIICLVIIAGWKISSVEDIKKRLLFFWHHYTKLIAFFLVALLIGSIQLIYWKMYAGHWIYWSYGKEETFSFLHPHILNGLFSYRKGWFIYTPVMILSVIGWWFLFRHFKLFFLSLFIFFILNVYIVFSWDCWWYGGSFSQRALVQSYAVLSFPIAALVQSVYKIKYPVRSLYGFILFCIGLNFTMTYQAYTRKNIMENNMMSKKYYWKIFGKLNIHPSDKKYIDVEEELPQDLQKKLVRIYFNDFEKEDLADTDASFSGKKGLLLSKTMQETKEVSIPVSRKSVYYRISVEVRAEGMEWNTWKQAQFIVSLKDQEKVIKTNFYRIYRIIEPGSWQKIDMDIQTPGGKPFDRLNVKFWNAGGEKELHLDDLEVQFAAK